MIFGEFVVILLASVMALVSIIPGIYNSAKSPILEMKLLSLGVTFAGFFFFLSLPIAYLSTPEELDPLGVKLARFAFLLPCFAILCWQLAFYLPNLSQSYRSQLWIIFLAFVDLSFALTNYYTLEFELTENGYILFSFTMEGLLSMFLAIGGFGVVMVYRLLEIRNSMNISDDFVFSVRYLGSFGLFMIMAPILAALPAISSISIPQYTFSLIMTFIFFLFYYGAVHAGNTLFLIPVKLIAVLITEHETGLVLVTQSFEENSQPEELLGGLFTALNISLGDAIKSKDNLQEISFGDKVVNIAIGDLISSIFIIYQRSMMVSYLNRQIVNRFEQRYTNQLSEPQGITSVDEFQGFKDDLVEMHKYFMK